MTLPVDVNSYDYKFNKTLNEDVKLKSDKYGFFDLDMCNGDYINVTGTNSLLNACIIAIMTRYNEIQNSTYENFGCRIYDLIKDNHTTMFLFKLETYVTETLSRIRRIYSVDNVQITEQPNDQFLIEFQVTSVNDEIVAGSVTL